MERIIGDRHCAACATAVIPITHVLDDEPEPPPLVCQSCGRTLKQIIVLYAETDLHGNLVDET